jgi:peptide-methionine (R)-S-oxide reductase
LPDEVKTMSRNYLWTLLLSGSILFFLELAAAAPPAAKETKKNKSAAVDGDESAKPEGTTSSSGKKKTVDDESNPPKTAKPEKPEKPEKIVKTDAEWRKILTPNQFRVTRKKWTEPAGTGIYAHTKKDGVYHCICCGEPLFDSKTKFESGTGWPSFFQPLDETALSELPDSTDGTQRTEVECSRCDAHLGHVFGDGPQPTGLRYCMNSASLKFVDRKKEQAAKNAKPAPSKSVPSKGAKADERVEDKESKNSR